jgi:hypothetical protein
MEVTACMSCAHCRKVIRWAEEKFRPDPELRFSSEEIEIVYAEPRELDVPGMVKEISRLGIVRLRIYKVFLDADGYVREGAGGQELVLKETGQVFPLLPSSAAATEGIHRVRARVHGWRRADRLALELIEIDGNPAT